MLGHIVGKLYLKVAETATEHLGSESAVLAVVLSLIDIDGLEL